jgi:hypothetical protein
MVNEVGKVRTLLSSSTVRTALPRRTHVPRSEKLDSNNCNRLIGLKHCDKMKLNPKVPSSHLPIFSLMEEHQFIIVIGITAFTASAIIAIFLYFSTQHAVRRNEFKSAIAASDSAAPPKKDVIPTQPEEKSSAQQRVVKKAISYTTVFDLEEFMVRLHKTGLFITRMKGDLGKKRVITIDDKGHLCLHKMLKSDPSYFRDTPYFKLSLRLLQECIPLEDKVPPTLLLDFKGKSLYLAVNSVVDRDYMVKGFRQIMAKVKSSDNFLKRSVAQIHTNSPMRHQTTSSGGRTDDYDDELIDDVDADDFDNMTVTTGITPIKR